jgi:hypothetical protein
VGKAGFDLEGIMKPLEMDNSVASFVRLKDTTNIIAHVPIDVKVIKQYQNNFMQLGFTQRKRFEQMGDYANE